jgi:hypothetical protein
MATLQEKCIVALSMVLQTRGEKKNKCEGTDCLPEGCIKQWFDETSGYHCLIKKCEQGEQ